MLLDDLVTTIQTVQARIRDHRDPLSQNEYRTRISLIDPILNALGWDVSDPSQVMLEYPTGEGRGEGRADYALLDSKGEPIAFIEAKHLGKMRDAEKHETQLITYAVTQGVRYAGLTDGNRWVFENLIARFEKQEKRRLLDVTISEESTGPCVAKLSWIWNLASEAGWATKSRETALTIEPEDESSSISPTSPELSLPRPEGIPLTEFQVYSHNLPFMIIFPNGANKQVNTWQSIFTQTAEYLIELEFLTVAKCPIGRFLKAEPKSGTGKPWRQDDYVQLSNDLFYNRNVRKEEQVKRAISLLNHFNQDPSSILLKPGQ